MSISDKETKVLFLARRVLNIDPMHPLIVEALAVLSGSKNAAIANQALMMQTKVPRVKKNG